MERYCLDADVLIQAKNGPYAFDIAPAFWQFIDQAVDSGQVYSTQPVYVELMEGQDELSNWASERQNSGLFPVPEAEVQEKYRLVADYVNANYAQAKAADFLKGADPWIIAQAINDRSIVVTHEKAVVSESSVVKKKNP